MSIDNLTFGELKQIAAMFSGQRAKQEHPMVGKYVIARCCSAGVHAGTVVSVNGDTAILSGSRRLWSWKAANGIALSGVAQHGIVAKESKVDAHNPEIYLTGVIELIPATQAAKESIDVV